jgi:predicted Zn-dependent peptidase
MIRFQQRRLSNGLKVILHNDSSTPLAAVNITYSVGSRDENPNKTGLAHLLEHLMFGGSLHIPQYDTPLQQAGGENNAFTSVDITNYYLSLPSQNLETAFWLESDRMKSPAFTQKKLDNQRSVVIEEFKQSYLNQPYGDAMLLLKPLAYRVHPYRWNTIGEKVEHIEQITLEEVTSFHRTFYSPANAVLAVAGKIDIEQTMDWIEKWFSDIEGSKGFERNLPAEPPQKGSRKLEVERQVPTDYLFKAYRMCKRSDEQYYGVDLLSDVLSNGKSARLPRFLVDGKKIFTSVDAYVLGSFDDGLFLIAGAPSEGVSLAQADEALQEELSRLRREPVSDFELEKVKNKVRTALYDSQLSVQDKAMELAIAETFSEAELVNREGALYDRVTAEEMLQAAQRTLIEEGCSTLYYHAISS